MPAPQIDLAPAVRALAEGQPKATAALCAELLARHPGSVEAMHLQGVAFQMLGDLPAALEVLERAAALAPGHAEIQAQLAVTLSRLGRFDPAIAAFQRSLSLAPASDATRGNYCIALGQAGRHAEWLQEAKNWATASPRNADAALQLARALIARGDVKAALTTADRAAALAPDRVEPALAQAEALGKLGRSRDRLAPLRRAWALAPKRLDIALRLALLERDLNQFDAAIATLKSILAVDPRHLEALLRLAECERMLCRMEDADATYARAIALKPGSGIEVMHATAVCPIELSEADILERRRVYRDRLRALRERRIEIADPYREAGHPDWYFLAYHGLDDRALQEELAALFLEACPSLSEVAPHIGRPTPRKRLRIGMVSSFLKDHTIGTLNRGLVAELDKARFELILFRPGGAEDPMARAMDRAASASVRLEFDLGKARRAIAEAELDLLYFPDIGMDSFTYFLAFARLAPVQVVSWGHPDTTGIPNLDYFLSVAGFETPEADAHYSETLIRLSRISSHFYRPTMAAPPKTRADFGLPETGNLYISLASLPKYHPSFDAILDDLLTRDRSAHVILNTGHYREWDRRLHGRIAGRNPEAARRVRFIDKVQHPDFFSLARLGDAFLDTTVFCGGRTCLELWAYGVPIVTLPSPFLRGRIAYGGYRQMGMTDLVARNERHYVDLCLALAGDKGKRAATSARISEASGALYEDKRAVREIEDFFAAAIAAAAKGEKLPGWPL